MVITFCQVKLPSYFLGPVSITKTELKNPHTCMHHAYKNGLYLNIDLNHMLIKIKKANENKMEKGKYHTGI